MENASNIFARLSNRWICCFFAVTFFNFAGLRVLSAQEQLSVSKQDLSPVVSAPQEPVAQPIAPPVVEAEIPLSNPVVTPLSEATPQNALPEMKQSEENLEHFEKQDLAEASLKKKENRRGLRSLLRYGQHSRFWNEVNALQSSEDPVEQTLSFMDKENYGAIEGIGRARFELLGINQDYWTDYFDTVGMGFDINTLAGGEVYNRISPRVRGYLTWDVGFFGYLSRKDLERGQSGWTWLLGSSFGMGRQKLVEGDAIDFLIKTPIKQTTLYYLGADFGLGYVSHFNDFMRFTYKGEFLPTFFYSEFDEPEYSYGVKQGSTRLRWRTEFEQSYAFQPLNEGGGEVAAHLIGGQQPTPVKILPRVWDSIHSIEVLPDYGTLFGIGATGRLYNAARNMSLAIYGGFYGGYVGYGGSVNIYGVTLEAGSFGFEQTSKYDLRETRIQYASLGFNYEW